MAKRLLIFTFLSAWLFFFQSCEHVSNKNSDAGSLEGISSCDTEMFKVFRDYYHPAFQSKCSNCHTSGPGFGTFAHPDVKKAFKAFSSLGRVRVERNFLNDKHQPGKTGQQNVGLVNSAKPAFETAEGPAFLCKSGSALVTSNKSTPGILGGPSTAWTTLEWNLESETLTSQMAGQYKMSASIEVRRVQAAAPGSPVLGYYFRNPRVKMNSATPPTYRVEGITLFLNGQPIADITTYSMVNWVFNDAINWINVSPNSSVPYIDGFTPNVSDGFAIGFEKVSDATGQPITIPIPETNPGPSLPTDMTYAGLMDGAAVTGVFAINCQPCHSGATPAGGFDITVYANAFSRASLIQTRMNSTVSPMPPSGILNSFNRGVVDVWITNGSKQ